MAELVVLADSVEGHLQKGCGNLESDISMLKTKIGRETGTGTREYTHEI